MPQSAKPASLKNVSFDTGVLYERLRIFEFIQTKWTEYPDVDWLLEELAKGPDGGNK